MAATLTPALGAKAATGNAQNKGLIELALFAPYNEIVELLGNWNDWKPTPMTKGEDGWWRAKVELADGDYLYKFRVKSLSFFAMGKMLEVFDPYALSVTDEASEAAILRIRGGQRSWVEYEWKHDEVPLPVNRDLVIYELHIGDFAAKDGKKGQFKDTIEKLDYLKDLGINCLELLPVKEFPGNGWGYSLRSLFGVENSYGPPDELCRLVDEAHARGMRVIIDGVYNHANSESPLTKIAFEYWYYKDNPDGKDMDWGPKFNYAHYDEKYKVFPARKYVIESIQFWIEKFHIDGIRFDATRAIKDFNVMRELTDSAFAKINGIKPFITIAEHVPEDPAITGRPEEGPMNAAWHDSFGRLMQAVVTLHEQAGHQPWNLDELETKCDPKKNGYKEGVRSVNFVSNHDYNREMRMLGDDSKIFGEAAFRRCALGLGILLTIPGLPMIWMGEEYGSPREKSLEPRPLNWDQLKNQNNQNLLNWVKAVTHIRQENPALRTDNFQVVLKDKDRWLFGYKRWDGGGNVVLVIVNIKDEPVSEFIIENAGLEDGNWKDAMHGNEIKVDGGVLKDTLGPSEVKIFIKQA